MAQTRDYVNQSVFRNQPIEQCEASASDFATQFCGQRKTRIFEPSEGKMGFVGRNPPVATLSQRRLSRERFILVGGLFSVEKRQYKVAL